jgi:hypothetical protein
VSEHAQLLWIQLNENLLNSFSDTNFIENVCVAKITRRMSFFETESQQNTLEPSCINAHHYVIISARFLHVEIFLLMQHSNNYSYLQKF